MVWLCSFSHNDLPWQLRKQFNNQLNKVDLYTLETTHTNIPKVKEGRLGAQVGRRQTKAHPPSPDFKELVSNGNQGFGPPRCSP